MNCHSVHVTLVQVQREQLSWVELLCSTSPVPLNTRGFTLQVHGTCTQHFSFPLIPHPFLHISRSFILILCAFLFLPRSLLPFLPSLFLIPSHSWSFVSHPDAQSGVRQGDTNGPKSNECGPSVLGSQTFSFCPVMLKNGLNVGQRLTSRQHQRQPVVSG